MMTKTATSQRLAASILLAAAATVLPAVQASAHSAGVPEFSPRSTRVLAFTMTSAQTRDMRGVEPSLYRGRFYRASVEAKRRCIVRRESSGRYDARSASGYRGAYQFSDDLADGATWMMLKEHSPLLGKTVAKRLMARLRKTPMDRWPRYWQDAAFHTVFNWERTGSGARHWRGGRWHC
mgnify:CR=1 FL=1